MSTLQYQCFVKGARLSLHSHLSYLKAKCPSKWHVSTLQYQPFVKGARPGFPNLGVRTPGGSQGFKKGVAKANVRIKIYFFSIREGEIIIKYH